MKTSIFKSISPLSLFLLAMMFLFSCSNIEEMAQYDINGTVTDATTIPLKNIRVIRSGTDYLLFNDTIYTDSLGKYSFNQTDFYSKNKTFTLKVEDIDGLLNHGDYTAQTINLVLNSSNWSFTTINKKLQGSAVVTQDFHLNTSK